MAGDPTKVVRRGDPIQFHASLFNDMTRAVALANRKQRVVSAPARPIPVPYPDGVVGWVRNLTGQTLPRFAVLAITEAAITPTANLGEFQARCFFNGYAPGGTYTEADESSSSGSSGSNQSESSSSHSSSSHSSASSASSPSSGSEGTSSSSIGVELSSASSSSASSQSSSSSGGQSSSSWSSSSASRSSTSSASSASSASSDHSSSSGEDITDPRHERHCVLLEPLLAESAGNQSIGRCIIAGAVPCQVDMVRESDQYCEAEAGTCSHFRSNPYGPYRILYVEPGTGIKWAYVRLADRPLFAVFELAGTWEAAPATERPSGYAYMTGCKPVYYLGASHTYAADTSDPTETVWCLAAYPGEERADVTAEHQSSGLFPAPLGCGDWAWCHYNEHEARWQVLGGYEDHWRFQTNGAIGHLGSVAATLLLANWAGIQTTSVTFTVKDSMGLICATLPAGTRGFARKFRDSCDWEIISISQCDIVLTESSSSSTSSVNSSSSSTSSASSSSSAVEQSSSSGSSSTSSASSASSGNSSSSSSSSTSSGNSSSSQSSQSSSSSTSSASSANSSSSSGDEPLQQPAITNVTNLTTATADVTVSSDDTGLTAFEVQRSPTAPGNWLSQGDMPASNPVTVTGLTPNWDYYFRARTMRNNRYSDWSDTVGPYHTPAS